MYDLALFGHLIGVVVLIGAVLMTVTGLVRAQHATTVSQIRVATGGVPVADRLIGPAMLLVLGFGLYLVSRHGDDGSIAWSDGWVVVSLTIFAVMAVLGPMVESKRAKALWNAACATTDEAITPEIDRLRRDPLLTHVSMFGSCQLVAFLFLMSNKPALPGAIAAVLIAALVSLVLTRVALHAVATPSREITPEGSSLARRQRTAVSTRRGERPGA